MEKVVVIGCDSFTGGYVVDELLKSGKYQVLGVDREKKSEVFVPYPSSPQGLPAFAMATAGELRASFRFVKLDLNRDMEELKTILTSEQPDYVMNLAALSEVAPSWDHPSEWMQTNVVALTELADHLRQLPSLRRFCQISTPEVYGSVSGRINESEAFNPSTPYAASKAGYDLLLQTFIKNYEFPAVMMRASNVYGAHQQLFKIVPRTAIYLKLGKTLQLHGGGYATRAYIHVRDVARAYVLGMISGRAGEVYHVSPDENVKVRELVQKICQSMGKDFESATEEVGARLGHDDVYMLDSGKIRGELGWKPEISLSDGLDESIRWVESNWEEIRQQTLEYAHRP